MDQDERESHQNSSVFRSEDRTNYRVRSRMQHNGSLPGHGEPYAQKLNHMVAD